MFLCILIGVEPLAQRWHHTQRYHAGRAWAWPLEVPRLLSSRGLLVALPWGTAWLPGVAAGGTLLTLVALGGGYRLRSMGAAAASAAGATS